MQKQLIGCKELISISELELFDLDAKIDTGADSNAIHCDDIHIYENIVTFKLHDEVHPSYHGKKITMPIYKIKKIKSSNGQIQRRPSIKVNVFFMGNKYETILSLSNRADMKYPMLIGRKFLENRFIVDVSQEYLSEEFRMDK